MQPFLKRCLALNAAAVLMAVAPSLAGATTLRVVPHAGLRSLDPAITSAYIIRNYGYMVYDTLFSQNSKGEYKPEMIDTWEVSDDGKKYNFTLRKGLRWHDGSPVTSEDVIASLKRWSKLDKPGGLAFSMIEKIAPIDERSFEIDLSEPSTFLFRALSHPSSIPAFIMPKELADTPTSKALTKSDGSGPFRFLMDEFKPGVKAVFEKNKDYVSRTEDPDALTGAKQVNVDRVEWMYMPDSMTAVNALLNKEVDYVEQVPHDLVPLLEDNPDVRIITDPLTSTQIAMRLNFLYPPFNNKKVRQAALLAIDQEAILKAQVGNENYYHTCSAIFGCGNAYAFDTYDDKLIKPHAEEAKKLLKEAGYDGTPVVLMYATDVPVTQNVPPIVAQQLRQAGFTVDVQTMDWQTLVSRRASKQAPEDGGWNAFVTFTVMSDLIDPSIFQWVAANGENAWVGWPDIPKIEKLRNSFIHEKDDDKLRDIAKQVNDDALDEVMLIPLGEFSPVTAVSTQVKNILSAQVPVFWNLEKVEN